MLPLTKTHPSIVRKTAHGHWSKSDTYQMDGARRLRIHTLKVSSGALVTTATVHTLKDGLETHAVYSDLSMRLEATHVRCTEKNVEGQHDRQNAEAVMKVAIAFYADKTPKAA